MKCGILGDDGDHQICRSGGGKSNVEQEEGEEKEEEEEQLQYDRQEICGDSDSLQLRLSVV